MKILDYINKEWVEPKVSECVNVVNPATGEVLAQTPLCGKAEVEAGNVGINIGVAAPMAFFPFSGWKDSFFGDMHGQRRKRLSSSHRRKL